MNMPKTGPRRLSQDVSLRISPAQREFLEKYAEKNDIGICAAVRDSIDEMMKNEDLTS